jgi:2-polyprenyl-3-methyl-5-hydroxy-6-metoxy-1,4-benzoquinol methylase
MASDNAFAWDRLAAWHLEHFPSHTDAVRYGPDVPSEQELRLCGDVSGKRIVELGCGAGSNAVALARQGAKVIAVDVSGEQQALARQLAEANDVRVELIHGDMADLSFITSASVDLVLSTQAFEYVDDLNRVFRQVHRILRPECALVFSTPHPMHQLLDASGGLPVVQRSYFDRSPMTHKLNGVPLTIYPQTVSGLFTSLLRANFRRHCHRA